MKSILIKDENDMSSQIKDLSNCGMFKKKSTQKNGEVLYNHCYFPNI